MRWVMARAAVALVGAVALVPGLLGLRYVTVGKHRHRDRLLRLVECETSLATAL